MLTYDPANEGGSIATAFAAGLTAGAAFWGIIVDIIGIQTFLNQVNFKG